MMFIKRQEYEDLKQTISQKDYLIEQLSHKIQRLEEIVPYCEKLKRIKPDKLKRIAQAEYGISPRMLDECDNSAEIIQEILLAKKELEALDGQV